MSADYTASAVRSPFHKYRGSVAWTEGYEKNLHVLGKDQYPDRALAVFTSGGDAQGSFDIICFVMLNPSIKLALCCLDKLLSYLLCTLYPFLPSLRVALYQLLRS